MTNRQRLQILLVTSAMAGGFVLSAAAAELPLPPVGVTTPPASKAETATAPANKAETATPPAHKVVQAKPAASKVAKETPRIHHRVVYPIVVAQPPVEQEPIRVASSAPLPSSCGYSCSLPLMLGVTY
jgi:hypothetical protein